MSKNESSVRVNNFALTRQVMFAKAFNDLSGRTKTMTLYELETKNGRIFKVVVTNANQEKRLFEVVEDNKSKTYELFCRVECINNGIHDIASFEKLADTLV
ncbi:MAG: hypothetical protein PHE67_05290 [Campylobacterales bacterium]|nr:hypothetical protein [Campylobacterales bacterium]